MANEQAETMEQELARLRQQQAQAYWTTVASNPVQFNLYMLGEMEKLKEGINQLGLLLSEALEPSVEEEVAVSVPVKPVVAPAPVKPAKKGFFKGLSDSAKAVTASDPDKQLV